MADEIDFGRVPSQYKKLEDYQDRLDKLTSEAQKTAEDLITLRRKNFNKKSAIILEAKAGIIVQIKGLQKLFKATNEEERESLLVHFLSADYEEEKALEEKLKYLNINSGNLRQLLSSEQSRVSAEKAVVSALG